MTQWIENPAGGRDRGPAGIARAFVEVLVRPRRFFRRAIASGDQAPGLVFAAVVVLIEEVSRFAIVALASRGIISTASVPYPFIGTLDPLESVLVLLVVVVFIVPAALHLTAALQTVLLAPFAPDRGGVSQTVQVIAYATAPCVFAGLPLPAIRVVCALWGSSLYVLGTSEIHDLPLGKAVALGAIPAIFVFGFGFRGLPALQTLV